MQKFSIKDVENLSGIKAHTLRIWEQRYQIIVPKRKDSNHRYYDNDDLKHILRVAYLYNNGYKISTIAKLDKEDLKHLTIVNTIEEHPKSKIINYLLEAAIDFNEEDFEQTLNKAISNYGFETCMLEVIYPFFERIGTMWLVDAAIPAQEHFSTNIIKRKIIVAIDSLPSIQTNNGTTERFILYTPEGEFHEIPLLLAYYLMKKKGKLVAYIGANMPLEDLVVIAKPRGITHLYFHAITSLVATNIDDYLLMLARHFRQQQIIMSGPLTDKVSVKPSNLTMLTSQDEKLKYFQNF